MLSQLLTTLADNAKLAVAVTAGAAMIAGGSAVALTQVADSSPSTHGSTVTLPLKAAEVDNDVEASDTPTATISPKPREAHESEAPDASESNATEKDAAEAPKTLDSSRGRSAATDNECDHHSPAAGTTTCASGSADAEANDSKDASEAPDPTEAPKPSRTPDAKDANETGVSGRHVPGDNDPAPPAGPVQRSADADTSGHDASTDGARDSGHDATHGSTGEGARADG